MLELPPPEPRFSSLWGGMPKPILCIGPGSLIILGYPPMASRSFLAIGSSALGIPDALINSSGSN